MKFRSKNKKATRVASLTGHIIIIDQEWVDVPKHMEGDAYAEGCISEEMLETIKGLDATADTTQVRHTDDRQAKILAGINKMIDSPEGNFTNAGLPNLKRLSDKCGFSVPKAEMFEAWALISTRRDAEEG